MTDTTIKAGDVVELITGGPKMTVGHVGEGHCGCTWFNKNSSNGGWDGPFSEHFPTASLKIVTK